MSEPSSSESRETTRGRLEQELARLRVQRRRLAAALGGEDPEDPDVGDRGDQANQLEGLDELARMDRRIGEIEHLIADRAAPDAGQGLLAGTVVTLRFPDGVVSTFRIVTITEEARAEDQNDVLTTGSPLGRALIGHQAGDTITYSGPEGDVQVEVVAMHTPTARSG